MFNELKQQLTAFEARVHGKVTELRGALRSLRTEVSTLDAVVVGPLEQVATTAGSVRGALQKKIASARAELSTLEPPR